MTDDALAQEAEAGAVVHLPTHHGRRLSQNALRGELDRAARAAGLGHVVPHQLRHTHATAMANAGVSLHALMALLGQLSAEMSLRYGKLFDTTVRTEYERALSLAKQRLGTMPESGSSTAKTSDPARANPVTTNQLAGQ